MDKAEAFYRDQLIWVARCGGNREGYRRTYSANKGNHHYADSIYVADIEELDKRYEEFLRFWDGSDRSDIDFDYDWYTRAVEVLGEGYFA